MPPLIRISAKIDDKVIPVSHLLIAGEKKLSPLTLTAPKLETAEFVSKVDPDEMAHKEPP